MQDFRKLNVWQRSHDLALRIYDVTTGFPSRELFGLTSQMRRSAASIPTNLAEGCGRTGDAELGRFAQIAMGSASELEYQLLLARDLGLLAPAAYSELSGAVIEVKKMLSRLISSLRAAPRTTSSANGASRRRENKSLADRQSETPTD